MENLVTVGCITSFIELFSGERPFLKGDGVAFSVYKTSVERAIGETSWFSKV